jgi:hypothetical protein
LLQEEKELYELLESANRSPSSSLLTDVEAEEFTPGKAEAVVAGEGDM